MRAQRDGYIVNISSMGGKIWEPLGSWYHASKFAVEGLSDSLRVEVAEFGIKVVIIEPGTIRSESSGCSRQTGNDLRRTPRTPDRPSLSEPGFAQLITCRSPAGPEVVAEVMPKRSRAPKPRTRSAGGGARGILLAERILPNRGFDRLIQWSYRLAAR